MKALGPFAFMDELTPEHLLQGAGKVNSEEESETLSDFAHDLATIQNLPEARR